MYLTSKFTKISHKLLEIFGRLAGLAVDVHGQVEQLLVGEQSRLRFPGLQALLGRHPRGRVRQHGQLKGVRPHLVRGVRFRATVKKG